MPFSSGTFSRVHDWTTDRDAGIKISASRTDAEFDGIATALTSTMLKDGSQTLTAMIPFTLGLSVPTDKKLQLRDSNIFLNSSASGQADLVANSVIQVTAPTVNIEASTAITLESDAITLGENGDTDIVLTFNANSADGVITWKEDEDYFLLSDDILMNSTEKIQFGDTASFIQQSSDGVLQIDGEATVNVNASTAFTVTTDTATFTSANANDPVVIIKNTTNDTAAARLHFVKDKGAAGADGDDIGTIEFISDDDGQTQTSFAKIVAEVSESANTDEAGKLSFFVAESDGTTTALTAGLVIEGEHATDGEVDVTIGAGVASTTSVAGVLAVAGGAVFNEDSADVDFRVESNGNANMLFVDGGNDALAVGTSSADTNATMTVSNTGDNHAISIVGALNKSRMHFQGANTGSASTDGLIIGLSSSDDTNDDSALIGLKESGSLTLQTNNTNHLIIDGNGHVTKPLQSAFQVKPNSDQSDIAVGSATTIVLDTEIFDQNADFASNTFTAPVTGKYQINAHILLGNIDSAASNYQLQIITSNRIYYYTVDPDFGQDNAFFPLQNNVLADMDASDTCVIKVNQSGGSSQTDILSTTSVVSGYLVC